MVVADLKKLIADLPDDMPIVWKVYYSWRHTHEKMDGNPFSVGSIGDDPNTPHKYECKEIPIGTPVFVVDATGFMDYDSHYE